MSLAEGLVLGLVYVVTIVCEGLGASWIGPERTYWPVLRLQKATLAAALTWYVSVALLSAWQPHVLGRFVANSGGVVLVMIDSLWSLYLIWRRNRVPAFLPLDLAGIPEARRLDYEATVREAASVTRHALISPHQAEILERGLERWRAMTPDERRAEREKAARAARRGRRNARRGSE